MKVEVKIDARGATRELAEARRDVNARTAVGLRKAGERIALPEARRRAPNRTGRLRRSLVVKSTARDAQLTTNLRGRQGRFVGLLEHGGTRTDVIKPRRKRALAFGGVVVTTVSQPRVYKAQRFMTGAVNAKRDEIAVAVRDEILNAFDGFEVT